MRRRPGRKPSATPGKSSPAEGKRYADGAEFRSWNNVAWVAWAPTEIPSRGAREAAAAFEKALWKGRHVLGVAADDTWLPPDLVTAADHRVELPALTAADVAAVARELCPGTDVPAEPTDLAAAFLTPPRPAPGAPPGAGRRRLPPEAATDRRRGCRHRGRGRESVRPVAPRDPHA